MSCLQRFAVQVIFFIICSSRIVQVICVCVVILFSYLIIILICIINRLLLDLCVNIFNQIVYRYLVVLLILCFYCFYVYLCSIATDFASQASHLIQNSVINQMSSSLIKFNKMSTTFSTTYFHHPRLPHSATISGQDHILSSFRYILDTLLTLIRHY